MTAQELKRYLTKLGATFEPHPGGSGHLNVYLNGKKSQLPMHSGKELKTGLVHGIKKQLCIK
jgi:mRNA interferase HicA